MFSLITGPISPQRGCFLWTHVTKQAFFKWHVPDFIWSHDHHMTKTHAASRAQVEDLQTAAQLKQKTQGKPAVSSWNVTWKKSWHSKVIFWARHLHGFTVKGVFAHRGGRKKNTTESCSFDQVGSKRKDIKNTKNRIVSAVRTSKFLEATMYLKHVDFDIFRSSLIREFLTPSTWDIPSNTWDLWPNLDKCW